MNDILKTVVYWCDTGTAASLFRLSKSAKGALTQEDLFKCYEREMRLVPPLERHFASRVSLVRISAADAPGALARILAANVCSDLEFSPEDFAAAHLCSRYRGNRRILNLLKPFEESAITDFSRYLVSRVELKERTRETPTWQMVLKMASFIFQRRIEEVGDFMSAFFKGACSGRFLLREIPEPNPEDSVLKTSICASVVEYMVLRFVEEKARGIVFIGEQADFDYCPLWVDRAPPLLPSVRHSDWVTPLFDQEPTFAKRNIIISRRRLNSFVQGSNLSE